MKTKEEIVQQKRKEYQRQWRDNNRDHIKELSANYRLTHKNKIKEDQKKWRDENREYMSIRYKKYTIENSEKIIEKSAKYYKQNKNILIEKAKNISKKNVKNLSDSYIKVVIHNSSGLKRDTINENPELIENYRQQIKVKRLLKTIKNGNKKAS